MNNYKDAKELYDMVITRNGYSHMSMIWTISCVEESLHAYDMVLDEEEKEQACNWVLQAWLDAEYNIGISRIADLVIENWYDLKEDKDAYDTIQGYIYDEVGV